LYEQLGIFNKSEKYYLIAKNIKEQTIGKKSTDYATLLHNLAGLYSQKNDYKKAEELYKESLKITERNVGVLSTDYAASLEDLAYVYTKSNRFAQAQQLLLQSLEITNTLYNSQHPEYALTINNLAKLYEQQQRWQRADSLYQISLKIFGSALGESTVFYTNTLFNTAQLYEKQGLYEKANQVYLQVIDKKHQEIIQVFPALSEAEKLKFYQNTLTFFNSYYTFALKYYTKNPAVMVQVAENQFLMKGLLFKNFRQFNQSLQKSLSPTTQALYQEWRSKKDWLAQLAYRNANNWRQQTALNKEKQVIVEEIETVEKQLFAQNQAALLTQNQLLRQLSWQDLQKNLQTNEVALELIKVFPTDSTTNYLCLITTAQTSLYPHIVVLENGNDLETSCLKFYQYSIREQRTDNESYNNFWQPIQEKVNLLTQNIAKDTLQIYVCPDGAYYQINLQTLLNSETGNYLIDEVNMIFLGNSYDIVEKKSKLFNESHKLSNGVLMGASLLGLPAVKTEIEQIHKICEEYHLDNQVYIDTLATENTIKKTASTSFLHIATHGFFTNTVEIDAPNQENPLLQCGLLLTDAKTSQPQEDGVLTGVEVMNLSLDSTHLVVLSACETGIGEVAQGEGVFGLQRAFLSAGAAKVMMSLWKVHDRATQLLMVNFYRNWLATNDLHQSFKNAQLNLRRKYPHPYYWGAFVCWE
jgi:CHAT domain-containing protein